MRSLGPRGARAIHIKSADEERAVRYSALTSTDSTRLYSYRSPIKTAGKMQYNRHRVRMKGFRW